MRITILAVGSRGDVQPYVALGLALSRSGHTVQIAALDDFEAFITENGLQFCSIGVSFEGLNLGHFLNALESGDNVVRTVRELARGVGAAFDSMLAGMWRACQSADAIVASLIGNLGGHHIAESLGVPYFLALLYPFTRTRAFPNFVFPLALDLGGPYNLLTHRLIEQLMSQPFRGATNRLRADTLGLPPMPPFHYPYQRLRGQPVPTLYGYSAAFIPRPADWDSRQHVTGYWFLDTDDSWTPPPELAAFLDAGPPPVYVGFGSMVDRDPAAVTRLVIEALDRTGQRGVFLTTWGGIDYAGFPSVLRADHLPDTIFPVRSVPHTWLFPRMAAVVHHGGAGTTAAGLRAGVPSILVPFMGDQVFWARQIRAAGVGPAPIPHRRLTADRLAHAIHVAAAHQPLRERAASLGERIRAENGVNSAAAVIDHYLSN